MQSIRLFLAIEAVAFAAASAVHFGLLVDGFEHATAGTAEGVIAGVLLAALVASALLPAHTRVVALLAQGVALVGTLIGIYAIVVGFGPQSTPDIVYHVAIVALLVWGLAVTFRSAEAEPSRAP